MANKKIYELTAHASIASTDVVPISATASGDAEKSTIDNIDDYLKATTKTLTNKTLTAPVIATIVNTGTLTLPTSTDTLIGRATTDTLTNKTLTSPVINVGSDATGDIYYRSSGVLTRLPIGSTSQVLTVAAGVPSRSAPSASSINIFTARSFI